MDREVIDAIKVAVEAAPEIWGLMDEMLEAEGGDEDGDGFREVLARAKDVTARLRSSIAAVQEGAHSLVLDGKALHDDAHLFVKVRLRPRPYLASARTLPRVCHDRRVYAARRCFALRPVRAPGGTLGFAPL